MKVIYWRLLLVASMALAGLYAGAFVGARYLVPKSAGLAGGVMVLGYVALGLLGFTIAGAIAAFMLKGPALRNAALIVGLPVVIAYLILTAGALYRRMADREPDAAFAAAGQFSAAMERLDTSDPYLFVKMEINSRDRTWAQTGPAPDHQVFHATMKAKTLVEIREGLDAVAAMSDEELADCRNAEGPAIMRLRWEFFDMPTPQNASAPTQQGVLDVSAACLREHFVITRALSLVEKASNAPGGKVKRK